MRTYEGGRGIQMSVIRLLSKMNTNVILQAEKYDKKFIETLLNGFIARRELLNEPNLDVFNLIKSKWTISHFDSDYFLSANFLLLISY